MYHTNVVVGGEVFQIAVNLAGYGAPTEEGLAGMFYVDLDSDDIYKCLGGSNWVAFQFSAIYVGAIPPEETKYILWIDTSVIPSPIKYRNESGVWVKTSGGSASGGSGSAEILTFDLVALGLADIPLDGTAVKLETDTTEIMAALDAGAVRFHVKLEYNGVVIDMVSTMHDISSPTGGGYICSCAFDPVGGFPLLVNITIEDGSITAMCTALGAGTGEGETVEVPTSIDLSGLDPDENNEGVIVETYADSSTKETKLTYDESGNIVEIEDADGNVTTLTW